MGQSTLSRYLRCIADFEAWLKDRQKKRNAQNLDMQVNRYITWLYDQDAELSVASYLIYGLQLLQCDVHKDSFLVNSKQSLAGWRKKEPGSMRVPVPEEFLFDAMDLALEQQKLDVAMAILIQYDGYLRPSECLTLTRDNVVAPQGKKYPHWAIIIAPSALHQTTKTGEADDSILLGDRPHNKWVGECLHLYLAHCGFELFPTLSLHSFELWCKQACQQLKYHSQCIMPHVIRHSAASNDAYHSRRHLNEIQKRGRWAARKSVTRYEKHALLLSQCRQITPSRKKIVEGRSQTIRSKLLASLRTTG